MIKRFSKNKQNKDKFFEYMFIDSGRILGVLGNEPPLMTTREELKVDKARDEWRKLIAHGWRKTKPVWEDSLVTNIVARVSYINYEIKYVVSG